MSSNILKITAVVLVVGVVLLLSGQPSVLAFVDPTSTNTPTSSISPAAPVTATATLTPTATATATATALATATATATLAAPTKTAAAAPSTATPTVKATATQTATTAATSTQTATTVATSTLTPTVKATATATPTKTATATPTKAVARAPLSPRTGTVSSISTSFVVQNTDPSVTANISATFYDTSGTATGPIVASVAPFRSTTIDQRVAGGVPGSPSTYQGSVVLSSNTQLASVVNEYAGNSFSLGSDFRADSYNGMSSAQASTSELLPQLLRNVTDSTQQKTYNSNIAIQNTSATASANVVITYTNAFTVTPPYVHSGITIPPVSSVFIDMMTENFPASFLGPNGMVFGSATITSDQNIAAVVNQNAAGALLVYRGFTSTDGGNSLIVTQALTSIFDAGQQLNYGSAVEGMTVNGSSVQVTVDYTNLWGTTKSCTLPSGSTFRIDFRPGNWPAGCTPPVNGLGQFFGSVKFTASTPIIALSNLQSDASPTKGVRASTSRAFVTTGGVTTGYAPLLMRDYLDAGTNVTWGTALEGKLLSGTGLVTINYYFTDGTTASDTYTAGADQIFRFDQRAGSIFGSGKSASAVITSAQPFVFTVNAQGASTTLGDALTVYMSQ